MKGKAHFTETRERKFGLFTKFFARFRKNWVADGHKREPSNGEFVPIGALKDIPYLKT